MIANPKDNSAKDKVPLHLWPMSATVLGALAFLDGASKYGRSNWRYTKVKASIYVDACQRHLARWFEGEDVDPIEEGGSGLSHLGHALACLAILVDAKAAGKLEDDRQIEGGFAAQIMEASEHIARIRASHADKNPKHYTIQDNPNAKS